jgi:hypothetical protein
MRTLSAASAHRLALEEARSGLEWLQDLGHQEKVTRRLRELGIKLQEPAPSRWTLYDWSRRKALQPVGLWFYDFMLQVFAARGAEWLTAKDVRRAIMDRTHQQVSKSLVTDWSLRVLLARAGIKLRARRIRGRIRVVCELRSLLRARSAALRASS